MTEDEIGRYDCLEPHFFDAPIPHVHIQTQQFCKGCGGELEFASDSWSWTASDKSVLTDSHIAHEKQDCILSVLHDIRRLLMDVRR